MTDEVNRDAVDGHVERLRGEYGDVPVEERTVELPGDRFERFVADARARAVGSGYAWVVRSADQSPDLSPTMPDHAISPRDRVLMILGKTNDEWSLPGGGLEAGETHEEAAVREVAEETGIECSLGPPFLLRRVALSPDDGDARAHFLSVFFDAAYEGGSISVQPAEVNGAAWFAEPPGRMRSAPERRAAEWFDE